MTMTLHTPTPWTPDQYGQLRGANGVPVNTKHLGLSQSLGGGPNHEAEANAAFIVQAVNCHDVLVETMVWLRQNYASGSTSTINARIQDALTLANAYERLPLSHTTAGSEV